MSVLTYLYPLTRLMTITHSCLYLEPTFVVDSQLNDVDVIRDQRPFVDDKQWRRGAIGAQLHLDALTLKNRLQSARVQRILDEGIDWGRYWFARSSAKYTCVQSTTDWTSLTSALHMHNKQMDDEMSQPMAISLTILDEFNVR